MGQEIVIVGAGIGGLTAALALLQQGFAVSIYEKAGAIGDVGAGISLGATASRGLSSLGLQPALERVADRARGNAAALHYRTGEVLGGAFQDRQWKLDELGPTYVIHRADLFALLECAVRERAPDALRLGHAVEAIGQDGEGIVAHFAGGRTARGGALIGCDGVRSTVRSQMFGPEAPRFTGQVAYRFLVPMQTARPFMQADPSGPFVGPGRSMTRYPIAKRDVVNCVAFVTTDRWTAEGWSARCSTAELESLFEDWHEDVRGLAASAPPEGTAKWALYDRDPVDRWVQGRVALLGDAAHPMLPFLGLGAAMAIEDAVILGRAFGQSATVTEALALYEKARTERAGLMVLESRRQAQAFKEGPGGTRRHTLTTHQERMRYDPSAVPL